MKKKKMKNSSFSLDTPNNTYTLDECKQCVHHKGMNGSFVECNFLIDNSVMIPSMPSFDIKGFKNGIVVVSCRK